MSNTHFQNMNLDERINHLKIRLGNPPGMISSLNDLLKLHTNKVYIAILPIQDNDSKPINTLIYEWEVGNVEDEDGNIITATSEINLKKQYFLFHNSYPSRALYCKDINLIPNIYNNQCVFDNEIDAKSYIVQHKLLSDQKMNFRKSDINGFELWVSKSNIKQYISIIKHIDNQ